MDRTTKKNILISSCGLGLAVLCLGYASFAWFTLGRTVYADGISLDVTAPNNIQISLKNSTDDADWSEHVTVDIKDVAEQAVQGYDKTQDNMFLLPSSTYAGFNDTVFYTTRAKTDGSTYENTVFNKGGMVKQTKDGFEGYYFDVPLYLRSATDDQNGVDLFLDQNKGDSPNGTYILPTIADNNLYKTARVAFLNEDGTKNAMNSTEPLVLASPDRGVTTGVITSDTVVGGTPIAPVYLSFTNNISDMAITHLNPAEYSGNNVNYSVTAITVRIWVEGQDKYCVVGVGGKSFTVGLKFTVAE